MEDSIFLLSKEEYEKYKDKIPYIDVWWWLRTPGCVDRVAISVNSDGFVDDNGFFVDYANYAVRPALKVSSVKSFEQFANNSFCALKNIWVKIDEDLAISEMPIAFSRFDEKSNDYAKSEIRQELLDWYEERKDL